VKKKLMLYLEIQQMVEQNFSLQQIARQLKISRTTVYTYLEMTPEEAFEWVNSLGSRKKKLDPYKDWIVAWLQEYPHLNASQIQDWLLEKFPKFTVGESTIRLYVNQIREEYQIAKTKVVRQYEAVEEQPMGKQMQVDWGETRQKKTGSEGNQIILYLFSALPFTLPLCRMAKPPLYDTGCHSQSRECFPILWGNAGGNRL